MTQTGEGVMATLPVKGVTEPRASACLAEKGGLAPGQEASLNACQGSMPSLVVQKAGVGFAMLMAAIAAITYQDILRIISGENLIP